MIRCTNCGANIVGDPVKPSFEDDIDSENAFCSGECLQDWKLYLDDLDACDAYREDYLD
jgi:hypothetical protein